MRNTKAKNWRNKINKINKLRAQKTTNNAKGDRRIIICFLFYHTIHFFFFTAQNLQQSLLLVYRISQRENWRKEKTVSTS